MVKIIIDYREKCLFESVQRIVRGNPNFSPFEIILGPLEIGDISVSVNDVEILFERKTMADWAASIKDGRLKEQKARLLASNASQRVMYLVEGCPTFSQLANGGPMHGLKSSVYVGSWISMCFKDGVHVTPTRDINETAAWVLEVAARLAKDPSKFALTISGGGEADVNEGLGVDTAYLACLKPKRRKIENITPDVCYLLMLCQIPGISMKIANDISTAFPTMTDLYTKLGQLETQQARIQRLSQLPGIGAKKAAVITEYLFVPNPNIGTI